MADLRVTVAGVDFSNPLIAAFRYIWFWKRI